MNALELRLFGGDAKRKERFRSAAQTIFAGAEGRYVLGELIKAAPPLAHSDGMTAHQHGNCEVVALLWLHGSPYGSMPDQTTPQTDDEK